MSKTKKNRFFARLCLCLMLASLCIPALTMRASAAPQGYWELSNVYESILITEKNKEYFDPFAVTIVMPGQERPDPIPIKEELLRFGGSSGSYSLSSTLLYGRCYNHGGNEHNHSNETLNVNFSFTEPPSVYEVGDEVGITMSAQAAFDGIYCDLNSFELQAAINYVPMQDFSSAEEIFELYPDGAYGIDGLVKAGVTNDQRDNRCEQNYAYSDSGLLEKRLEYAEDSKLLIKFRVNRGNTEDFLYLVYEYTWTEGEAPFAHTVTGDADNTPGESDGVDIPPAVFIAPPVLLGGWWAGKKLSGKNAKTSSKKERTEDEPEEEKDSSCYEMRVYKDFGDTIYVGKSVTVGARIVELPASGGERPAPAMTSRILISSPGYLDVSGGFISGQYQSAKVTAPDDGGVPPQTAIVSFRLTGAGGTFTNNVRFKIKKSEPRVVFPDMPAWASGMFLDIIAGDNATYRVKFFFEDVNEEPEKIVFGRYESYEITVEPADTMYTYWAVVKNRTAPMDNRRIYDRYPFEYVGLTATFKDGTEVSGSFLINRYPEGLSVAARTTAGGRIPVLAYEKEQHGGLDKAYQPTELRFTCARRTEGGSEVITPKDDDLIFGELCGDGGEKTENVAKKYQYKMTAGSFEPLQTLFQPQPGDTYPMTINVAWAQKRSDALTLPLSFELKPKDPMEGWREEHQKLKERIVYFTTSENIRGYIEKFKQLTPDNVSVSELRLMNKAILQDYIRYWESESREYMAEDSRLAKWQTGAEVAKFFGDCAFSYLVVTLGGGPFVDAVLSPAKNFFADIIGRFGGSILFFEGESNLDGIVTMATENVKAAVDDVLYEMVKGSFKNPPSIARLGAILSAYLMYTFFANLLKNKVDEFDPGSMLSEEERQKPRYLSSIYEALVGTFCDLGGRALGEALGAAFRKFLRTSTYRKYFGNFLKGKIHDRILKQLDIDLSKSKPFVTTEVVFEAYKGQDSLRLDPSIKRTATFRGLVETAFGKALGAGWGYSVQKTKATVEAGVQQLEQDVALLVDNVFDFVVEPDGNEYLIINLYIPDTDIDFEMHYNMTKMYVEHINNGLFKDIFDFFCSLIPGFPEPIGMPQDPPLPEEL